MKLEKSSAKFSRSSFVIRLVNPLHLLFSGSLRPRPKNGFSLSVVFSFSSLTHPERSRFAFNITDPTPFSIFYTSNSHVIKKISDFFSFLLRKIWQAFDSLNGEGTERQKHEEEGAGIEPRYIFLKNILKVILLSLPISQAIQRRFSNAVTLA